MKAKDAITEVARRRNMTPQQVKAEIQLAIREAMSSPDPKVQLLWKQIAPDGKEPSAEEFLEFCVNKLNASDMF